MNQLRIALTLVAATLALAIGVAKAAPAASPDTKLSGPQRAEIVRTVSEILNESYIFSDVAARMGRLIENNLVAGKYDGLETLGELTSQLTEDLRSVSHDLHLSVDPLHEDAEEDPEEEAAIRARRLPLRDEKEHFAKAIIRCQLRENVTPIPGRDRLDCQDDVRLELTELGERRFDGVFVVQVDECHLRIVQTFRNLAGRLG